MIVYSINDAHSPRVTLRRFERTPGGWSQSHCDVQAESVTEARHRRHPRLVEGRRVRSEDLWEESQNCMDDRYDLEFAMGIAPGRVTP